MRTRALLVVVSVACVTAALLGIPSSAQAATTLPDAPTQLWAVAHDGGAELSWAAPVLDGGSPITGYLIVASPGGATAVTSADTSFTVSGLTDGTTYTFKVSAINAVGTGPASAVSNAVTPKAPTIPSAPIGSAAFPGNQSARVTWTAPPSDGGSPITSYSLTFVPFVNGQTGTPITATTADGSAREFTETGLTNGVYYDIYVRATNSLGTGPSDINDPWVIPNGTAPGPPASVQAVAATGNKITISWTPPSDIGGSAITGYHVSATPGTVAVDVPATAQSATLTFPAGTGAVTPTVQAVNAKGLGTAQTADPITPGVTVGAATSVLSTASLNALTSVSDTGALTFVNAPAQVLGWTSGTILVASVSTNTPEGLLRTVDAVTTSGTTTTVLTSDASLNDAISAGGLSTVTELTNGDVADFTPAMAGVKRVKAAASGAFKIALDTTLKEGADGSKIQVSGQVGIKPTVSFGVSVACCFHVNTHFSATLTESASVKLSADLPAADLSRSKLLGSTTYGALVFAVGPVPVVLTPKLDIYLEADGSVSVGMTAGADLTATQGVDLKTDGSNVSASPINTHSISFTPPTAFAGGDLDVGSREDFSIALYGVIGPYERTEIFPISLEANTADDPWWTLSLKVDEGAGVKLSVEGHDLVDWEDPSIVDGLKYQYADAGGPFMGVTITPDPAKVAAGGTIQLHATVNRSPLQNVTWSVGAGHGTITANGLYTAPSTPGNYKVTATSPANGLKPKTEGDLSVTVGGQPPDPPTAVTASLGSNNAVTVEWNAPNDDGGSPISGYTVRSDPAGLSASVSGTVQSAVFPSVNLKKGYQFTVTATNAVGDSVTSAPAPVIAVNLTDPPPQTCSQRSCEIFVDNDSTLSRSGLLNDLAWQFKAAHPEYDLLIYGHGSEDALSYAEGGSGYNDVLLLNTPNKENEFVGYGYSYEAAGRAIAASDYVLVGPPNDPVDVSSRPHDMVSAFEAIAAAGARGHATYVSRDPGTGSGEREGDIWSRTTGVPTCILDGTVWGSGDMPSTVGGKCGDTWYPPSWYRANAAPADEELEDIRDCHDFFGPNPIQQIVYTSPCYGLVDRETYDRYKKAGALGDLKILVQNNAASARGGSSLLTEQTHGYVNSLSANIPGAKVFLNWLTLPGTQTFISNYLAGQNGGTGPLQPVASPNLTGTANASSVTSGNSFKVTGSVVNQMPGSPPLNGVTVTLKKTVNGNTTVADTTTTGSAGNYTITYKPSATATYTVSVGDITKVEKSSLSPPFKDILTGTSTSVGKVTVK